VFRLAAALLALGAQLPAQTVQRVVDIPTRPGVSERAIVLTPPDPKAAVVLLAGSHGGLQLSPDGSMQWGKGNFLVRSRQLFADHGLMVIVLDAPSDRQSAPFLDGFRETRKHADDLKAVIAWTRQQAAIPVWLVGTSRGTQSAAYVATELVGRDGPDGVVLTSTILREGLERAVPDMALGKIRVPVLVVHHEQDRCRSTPFPFVSDVMKKLVNAPRRDLLTFRGGKNEGDPCEAFAYHGFNGLEPQVVDKIVAWVLVQ
jgi:pimeloyl-ACP methyl ester carboxylesterase